MLEGIIIEKISRPPLHSSVTQTLLQKLRAAMGEKLDVRQEQPITCRRSEPEPDLALVGISPDNYASGHPHTAELVIEIAVSSAGIDRRKASIYAAAGVREYWIVLPETRRVEVLAKPTRSNFTTERTFTNGQTAVSEILPNFQVELSTLFPR